MKTDTLLAFLKEHPECEPHGLWWDESDNEWCKNLVAYNDDGTFGQHACRIPNEWAHALIADKVMDAMGKLTHQWDLMPDSNGEWGVHWGKSQTDYWAPTRLEALIEAYKAEVADG